MNTTIEKFTQDLFMNPCDVLKDHPQIPSIVDILSRQQQHHVHLTGIKSKKIKLALLQSIAYQLTAGQIPKILRNINFVFVDVNQFTHYSENLSTEWQAFLDQLIAEQQRTIIAINAIPLPLLTPYLNNDIFRFIYLGEETIPHFNKVPLNSLSHSETLALLKTYKDELEKFHHVLIPDEIFSSALGITSHYLTSHDYFDKTLELLDSAAARASTLEYTQPGHPKPLVSSNTLTQVVSSWTQIPITHLYNNNFHSGKFIEALQRRIFGQENAINQLGTTLQQAYLKLQEKKGPLCTFLFIGSSETGKTTTAFSLAEHLFGHKNALLQINLNENYQSLAEVKIIHDQHHSTTLLEAIEKTPYAIVLIENIHEIKKPILQLFNHIFTQGFAEDEQGNLYNFRHAIFIMTTTMGSDRIATIMQTPANQDTKTLDLMQLVLYATPQEVASEIQPHLSTHEICEALSPMLEEFFSSSLLEHTHIIPFLPLDYAAYEKIIRLKIKNFAKRLETHFDVELNYAAEVIKFLAHEAVWRKPNTKSLEKLLEQQLYAAVAKELLAHAEDKNRGKRLLLQLNDGGQLLRCEFMHAANTMNY